MERSGNKSATVWHVQDTEVNYHLLGTFRTERAARHYAARLESGKRPYSRRGFPFRPTCPYCRELNASTARKCSACGGRLV